MYIWECIRVHICIIHSNKGVIGRKPGALYGSRYRIESRSNLHVVIAEVVSKRSCSTAAKVLFLASQRPYDGIHRDDIGLDRCCIETTLFRRSKYCSPWSSPNTFDASFRYTRASNRFRLNILNAGRERHGEMRDH